MPRSIQCPHCGVVLNLPAQAQGRRLKCPKCAMKFQAEVAREQPPASAAGASGSSTIELARKQRSEELPVMPVAAGDLRDTFDDAMMREAAPSSPASTEGGGTADALALFNDRPSAPRRKTGAEARAQSRRCPTCGAVVPVGMSLCNTCGLDLDTGTRIDLDDDLAPPARSRSQSMPIPMAVVGGLSLTGSIALAIVAFVTWIGGKDGAQYFIPVAAFGGYAAYQFLRSKSVKLLLAALTLGAVIDLAGLIALPVYNANADATVVEASANGDDPDAIGERMLSVNERLDTNKLSIGITVLFLYAVVSIYLVSPQVNHHFRK